MARYDLEEITAGRFIVRDPRANTLLKGEGELVGNRFILTSHRRDGLMARLRERGFRVRTLEDRLDALPQLPDPPPLGEPTWHPLSSPSERLSAFDVEQLRWAPLETEQRAGRSGVLLPSGWPVRRRKGRGVPEFLLARGGQRQPLSEDQALLLGYALAAQRAPRLLVPLTETEGMAVALLPDVDLPPRHRELLQVITRDTPAGPAVDEGSWPLAVEVFARLGVRLESET
ncbi:MAG: hypothetical protein RLZZ387_2848 [Chloroflexota bacterium]|jgi:hypothetical protein